MGKWELVDLVVREPLQRVVPANPAKGCVVYDMKKRPSEYVAATYRMCRETGQDFCFAPLSRKCVPRHFKVDTETCSQMFVNSKAARKNALSRFVQYKYVDAARKSEFSRLDFNDFIWNSAGQEKS